MIGREVGILSLHDIRITVDDRGIACTPFTGSSASKINKHLDYIVINKYCYIEEKILSVYIRNQTIAKKPEKNSGLDGI